MITKTVAKVPMRIKKFPTKKKKYGKLKTTIKVSQPQIKPGRKVKTETSCKIWPMVVSNFFNQ